MKKYDFHIHTAYCDGKNTPREMVVKAIEEGFEAIGFSGHSYTSFDKEWCMSAKNSEKYYNEISDLKEEFSSKIQILCGIEQDIYADYPWKGRYDYAIGSVHYVRINNEYVSVDESEKEFLRIVNKYYNGDTLSFAKDYYATVAQVLKVTGADIIGHFDLITKFNSGEKFFKTSDKRYIAAWRKAVDELIPYKKPFEVNVGAIARGYANEPYPAVDILNYIREKKGRVIFSGDCHDTSCIGKYMTEADNVVKKAGFHSMFNEIPRF